jgi:general stress protein 26
VSGRGAISNDRERIKELFSVAAKAWWDASDDPNIRLLTVTPDGGRVLGRPRQSCEHDQHDRRRGDWRAAECRKNEKVSMA